jgi:hypothetical protein
VVVVIVVGGSRSMRRGGGGDGYGAGVGSSFESRGTTAISRSQDPLALRLSREGVASQHVATEKHQQ